MLSADEGKPGGTRQQILDAAEEAVLAKGFGATSIEELIAAVGISKSGFFYHFRDKGELAKALLNRYIERDDKIFDDIFSQADDLDEDPLHSFLIALKILSDLFRDLPGGHPGCLVASICYHEQLFDQGVQALNTTAVLKWRARFRARLVKIAAVYELSAEHDLDDLADMFSSIADGGIILAKVTREPEVLARQMLLYRSFIRLVFSKKREAA
ncbi:TetR family transcriptional regulator [Alphaproteobacteria bacterium HT1-32]|nr:TetR family transcriptional regulator [Alphaproteobacteria bacterium HT1-32]